jgi:negative regulator of flagellin synthesis FlgM
MQIYGPSGVHGAQSVSAPHNNRRVDGPQSTQSAQPQDELSLSSEATYVDQVRSLPDVRQDRINSIRQAIADGTYETEHKLDSALSALLDEIA